MSIDLSDSLLSAIVHNEVESTRLLIDQYGFGSPEISFDANHFFWPAIEMGHLEISELLLDNGAEVNIKDDKGETPLHHAAGSGNPMKVRFLMERNASVDEKSNDRKSALHKAVECGSSEIVSMLLEENAAVNMKDNEGVTPLHYAAEKSFLEIVKLLIAGNASINARSNAGKSSLHRAARTCSNAVVEELLNCGASVNEMCNNGLTPLHYAVPMSHSPVIMLLLDKGADINATTTNKETPLHLAIPGNRRIVEMLLKRGANTESLDKDGKSVLYKVVEHRCLEMLKLLLTYRLRVKSEANQKAFYLAIYSDYFLSNYQVEALLRYGFTVRKADAKNSKFLYAVVKGGYSEIMESLLKFEVDVNALDLEEEGKTLLHTAAYHRRYEIVVMLLRKGANVSRKDKMQKRAIDYAIQVSDTEITKTLLDSGATIKMSKELLRSAVKMACSEIVKITLNKAWHLDINEMDDRGWTILHHSLQAGCDYSSRGEIVKTLIIRGASVHAQTKIGMTPLHFASEGGYATAVEVLLANGADINAVGEYGRKPLHLAVTSRNLETPEMLLDSGANIHDRMDNGNTALHIAVNCWNPAMIKLLVERGADLDARGENQLLPLHMTINYDIMEALLRLGANPNAKDIDDETVIEKLLLYDEHGCHRSIQILLDYGADVNVIPSTVDFDMAMDTNVELMCDTVKKHIIAMMTLDRYVSDGLIKKMEQTTNYKDFLEKCNSKIALMKTNKIGDTNFTLYDILTTDDKNKLAIYAQYESIVEAVESEDLDDIILPTHANMITRRIRLGQERDKLLNPSHDSLNALSGRVLPQIFALMVFNYLNNEDLDNLVNADPTDDDSDN